MRSSNGSYEFIDFRETAPAAAFQDMYNENKNLSLYGGLARYKPTEESSSDSTETCGLVVFLVKYEA